MNRLDDLDAYELEDWFSTPTEPLRERLQDELDQRRGKNAIELEEAVDLVQAWFAFEAYRSFGSQVEPLLVEDKERRYILEEVAIPVSQDATIAAALVRPRSATAVRELPTLLEFTLDRSSRDAREAAAHGYASVLALSRIAGDPASRPRAPFESEGRRRARRHRVDRQAVVEQRPRRHAGRMATAASSHGRQRNACRRR